MPMDMELLLCLIVVIAFPLSLAATVWLTLHYRHRRNERMHATITYLADKGLAIPHELLSPTAPIKSRLHRALTVTGLGIGLVAYLWMSHNPHWSIGLVPLLVGLAQLLALRLDWRSGHGDR